MDANASGRRRDCSIARSLMARNKSYDESSQRDINSGATNDDEGSMSCDLTRRARVFPSSSSHHQGLSRVIDLTNESVLPLVEQEEARLRSRRLTETHHPHHVHHQRRDASIQARPHHLNLSPAPAVPSAGALATPATGPCNLGHPISSSVTSYSNIMTSSISGSSFSGTSSQSGRPGASQDTSQQQAASDQPPSSSSHHHRPRDSSRHRRHPPRQSSSHASSSLEGGRSSSSSMGGPGLGIVKTNTAWFQRKIHLRPQSRGIHLIHDELMKQLPEMNEFLVGMCHIQVMHTSASLALNENWDPDVREDMEMFLSNLVPESTPFRHSCEGPDDMPAHIKACFMGSSLNLPITEGKLNLGTWQGIWLCEHRNRAGSRKLVVTINGALRNG